MQQKSRNGLDRRMFLKQAGIAAAATGMTAKSYARILGANGHIQLGCGDRSEGHVHMVQLASRQTAVEVVAVGNLWSLAREHRAAQVKKAFGFEARQHKYS